MFNIGAPTLVGSEGFRFSEKWGVARVLVLLVGLGDASTWYEVLQIDAGSKRQEMIFVRKNCPPIKTALFPRRYIRRLRQCNYVL